MSKGLENKKSQVSTMDLFIAVSIFVILFTIIMATWNNYNNKINEKTENYELMAKAFQISDLLVKTSGYPSGWTAENVKVMGLATEDRILSEEKVAAFISMNVSKTKDVLHLYGDNFYFTLQNGSTNITYGFQPTGKKTAAITRYVLFKNEKSAMRFYLWR